MAGEVADAPAVDGGPGEGGEFTASLRSVINDGMRQGVFRRVNDQLLAVQPLSMISSLYRWHQSEDERSAGLVADTIISYLYEGVLARPAE